MENYRITIIGACLQLLCTPNPNVWTTRVNYYYYRSWSNYTNCVDYADFDFRNAMNSLTVIGKAFRMYVLFSFLLHFHTLQDTFGQMQSDVKYFQKCFTFCGEKRLKKSIKNNYQFNLHYISKPFPL